MKTKDRIEIFYPRVWRAMLTENSEHYYLQNSYLIVSCDRHRNRMTQEAISSENAKNI